MNTPLDTQITGARSILTAAAGQNDLGLAKLAVGMLAGAVAAAAPEDRYSQIFQAAQEAGSEKSMDAVFGIASWLIRQGSDFI